MRRLLFASVIVLLFAAPSLAQVTGYPPDWPAPCDHCGILSYVDLPGQADTVLVSQGAFWLQGWGAECRSGIAADRLEVYIQDDTGLYHPLPPQDHGQSAFGGNGRPDVPPYLISRGCSNVQDDGYAWYLQLLNAPLGLHRYAIQVWYGPFHETHSRTYLVIP